MSLSGATKRTVASQSGVAVKCRCTVSQTRGFRGMREPLFLSIYQPEERIQQRGTAQICLAVSSASTPISSSVRMRGASRQTMQTKSTEVPSQIFA